MKNVVECERLTKCFREGKRTFVALNDVSFRLEPGKIFGLLGPDGAGKTTLIRCLAGLYRPTSGNISVLGLNLPKQSSLVQGRLGYLPQKFGLYENLTVWENLNLYAELRAVPGREKKGRFARLLEITDLSKFSKRAAGNLSGGMKQKLALACSLVSEPELILLDEPTVGVDVLSRRELWAILRQIVEAERTTVFASSAYMDEASFCDRTLVLAEGRLVADAVPDEIRRQASSFSPSPTFEQGFLALTTGSVPEPFERKNPVAADAPIMVRADRLVKKFGAFTAVDSVSFDVRRGEIFGLLGANGAGKTTTFRILCGLGASDSGTIEIGGIELAGNVREIWRRIGYVAQNFSLYSDLTVRQNMAFFGGVYGLNQEKLRDRIERALDSFRLRDSANRVAARLPAGYKRRLSMACALLHEPPILFLDEATSGADPATRYEFWKTTTRLADSGVSVVITTHFLDEARFCDRMIVMQDGRVVASGTVAEIVRQGGNAVNLEEAFVNIIRGDNRRRAFDV